MTCYAANVSPCSPDASCQLNIIRRSRMHAPQNCPTETRSPPTATGAGVAGAGVASSAGAGVESSTGAGVVTSAGAGVETSGRPQTKGA